MKNSTLEIPPSFAQDFHMEFIKKKNNNLLLPIFPFLASFSETIQ